MPSRAGPFDFSGIAQCATVCIMKRGFLFGLSSFLILGAIVSLAKFEISLAIVALVLMPVSVITIRAANRAPPNRSRLHAVFGWLIGFFVIDAVILALVGVVLLATATP